MDETIEELKSKLPVGVPVSDYTPEQRGVVGRIDTLLDAKILADLEQEEKNGK